ncbi:hypothetical protein [Amycolatopsis sp. TNS106]|uniref:hypothetical protein n=1 Tax=Amycolatopsis sp. TNS106 TaxID=2861750 RepID=UPI00210791CE|nr:hypothetical protein [Amycolatopsis sp. TNS106]
MAVLSRSSPPTATPSTRLAAPPTPSISVTARAAIRSTVLSEIVSVPRSSSAGSAALEAGLGVVVVVMISPGRGR